MTLRRSAEDYLEAIYVLQLQGERVRSVDVAHHLDFSKPSVSRAVNQLKADGYLLVQEDGALLFTDKGRESAQKVYERHTILTALLTRIGVPAAVAAEDACQIEHAISEETFACLKAAYQRPAGTTPAAGDAKTPRPEAGKAGNDKKKKKKKKG